MSPEAGGEVEFRNIRFELTDDTNLLKNPNFFFRGSNGKFKSWQLIAGESITSENGIMTLTPKGDAAAVHLALHLDLFRRTFGLILC